MTENQIKQLSTDIDKLTPAQQMLLLAYVQGIALGLTQQDTKKPA